MTAGGNPPRNTPNTQKQAGKVFRSLPRLLPYSAVTFPSPSVAAGRAVSFAPLTCASLHFHATAPNPPLRPAQRKAVLSRLHSRIKNGNLAPSSASSESSTL